MVLASLQDAELSLLHKITCDWAGRWIDALVPFVDDEWFGGGMVALLLLLAGLTASGRVRLERAVIVLLVTLGVSHLVREAIWRTLPRERPGNLFAKEEILQGAAEIATCADHPKMWVERTHPPKSASFPSSHAVTIASAAFGIGLAARWAGAVAWLYALLVCWGRLYQGKHWPSDMLGSLLLVMLVGWGAVRVLDAWREKRKARLEPPGPGT